MKELDLDTVYAEGAKSMALELGLSEKDAEVVAEGLCKQARSRRVVSDDEDDEDSGTWWDRNKHWVLPTGIGLAAFLAGGDAGRYGRPDWNYFSNAGGRFMERLKALLGMPDSAAWRSMTHADPSKLLHEPDKAKSELADLVSIPKDTDGGSNAQGGATKGNAFPLVLNGRMPAARIPSLPEPASTGMDYRRGGE